MRRKLLLKFCPRCAGPLKLREIMDAVRLACATCDYVFWDNPIPVAAAVLLRGEEVVLVRPTYMPEGRWGLPGGFVEKGERAEEAVVREIFEETNLRADVEQLIGTYSINRPDKNILYIVFYAKNLGGELTAGNEIAEITTLIPQKAIELLGKTVAGKAVADWMDTKTGGRAAFRTEFPSTR